MGRPQGLLSDFHFHNLYMPTCVVILLQPAGWFSGHRTLTGIWIYVLQVQSSSLLSEMSLLTEMTSVVLGPSPEAHFPKAHHPFQNPFLGDVRLRGRSGGPERRSRFPRSPPGGRSAVAPSAAVAGLRRAEPGRACAFLAAFSYRGRPPLPWRSATHTVTKKDKTSFNQSLAERKLFIYNRTTGESSGAQRQELGV